MNPLDQKFSVLAHTVFNIVVLVPLNLNIGKFWESVIPIAYRTNKWYWTQAMTSFLPECQSRE